LAIKCPKCHSENPETKQFCADCGTQLPSPKANPPVMTETLQTPVHELSRGTTIAGRYEIIEELGRGGMGKVYRVEDKKIKAEIALKLIKPEISSDKNTIERFSNELKTTRMISHRNVCRMFDLGEEKGTYFITMEYVAGQDLRGLIRQTGQLTIGKAIAIAKQISEGLAEAHRLGVIHRDLKPSNIIIDREGNARIMDFGIARSLHGKSLTGEGVVIGTPEYMSPEQVEGKEADQRSDIYSLGIVLYEMLTGRAPFEGDTPLSIAVKHKTEKPKDPKEFNDQIPDDLSRLVLRCLEKDKSKRYQSADDVRSELENIEKGLPTTAHEIPKRKPLTSRQITVTFGAKKLLIPALGVAAFALIALVIWRFLPKHHIVPPPSGKPSLAIVYFENISGDKSLDAWKTGLTELLITKLSQSKFISVLSSDRIFSILRRLNLQEAKKYSTEDLVKVADEGGAVYTLSGSLMKAGETIIMTLTLQKPRTGEVISPLNIECNGEKEIFAKVDELARTIKSDMNLTPDQIAADHDMEVGKITTTSPEAYKYYSEARRYHTNYEYRKSIPLMEKAIAIDPGFAMAYRSLAIAYDQFGYYSESKKNRQKAFELSDRVSERERYIIQGDFYRYSERTYDKAIETYNKLLQLYPDDRIGNINGAELYMGLEEWDKAIERSGAAIKYKDSSIYPYADIASDYMAKGQYEKATEAQEFYIKTFGDNFNMRQELALIHLCQGEYAPALLEVGKALMLNPGDNDSVLLRGQISLCQGNLSTAEKDFETLLESEAKIVHLRGRDSLATLCVLQGKFGVAKNHCDLGIDEAKELNQWAYESRFHLYLAYLHLKLGNYEEALKECDKAWAVATVNDFSAHERGCIYWRAMIFLERNQIDRAQQAAVELRSLIEKGLNKKLMRMYRNVEGIIELKRNNLSKAVDDFNEAISLLPNQYFVGSEHALYFDCLAQAYYRAGALDKARKEYEKITLLAVGRVWPGDIYAKAFYMLGKIAEQQGDKARAITNYRKFLDLWKDADAGLPEVEDAKKRLAGLTGS